MTPILPQWPQRSVILDLLGPWLTAQRWFPGTDTRHARVIHYADFAEDERFRILVIALESGAWVHVPLVWEPTWDGPGLICGTDEGDGVLVDAVTHPGFLATWLASAREAGTLGLLGTQDPSAIAAQLARELPSARPLGQEQSNSSVVLAGDVPAMIKFFRVLVVGDHPEVAVPLALAADGFDAVPTPLGYSTMMVGGPEHQAERVCTATIAALVPDAEDGFARFTAHARDGIDPTEDARALGQMTRELHTHLLHALGHAEPMTGGGLALRITTEARLAIAASLELRTDQASLERLDALAELLQTLGALPPAQRIHGDYHLGQCLYSQGKWFVLDFEGEPLRPLDERIAPDEKLRDVAGMLRSFDYARAVGGADDAWCRAAEDAYLAGYFGEAGPTQAEDVLLQAFVIEKALYEVRYEAGQRPDWEYIPLTALRRALTNFG
ncbi:MAG: hypothetical protein E7A62_05665 [Actinomycetaceae bacterium]|nr:hypothetical protein [Actinomycetaceae bacterium]MDU0970472.1 hypothetical protein [Actinomycetaceae bacterium]